MLTEEQVEEQLQIIEDNAWWIGNGQDKPELIPDEIWKIKENHIGDARQVILSHIDHLQAKLKEAIILAAEWEDRAEYAKECNGEITAENLELCEKLEKATVKLKEVQEAAELYYVGNSVVYKTPDEAPRGITLTGFYMIQEDTFHKIIERLAEAVGDKK